MTSPVLETPVLETRGVSAGYGRMHIVRDVDIAVPEQTLVTIIGLNGAGKSTVLKAVLGLNRLFAGQIFIDGADVTRMATHARVALGLGYVPQGRQVFPDLTVTENLRMGGFRMKTGVAERCDEMFELFPRLRERAYVAAGRLSGGEQQMLAMGRALMTRPKVLVLDEPTLGLAPALVELVMEQILSMKRAGYSMLMVEQNATLALQVSDFGYVVEGGTAGSRYAAGDLLARDDIKDRYLGGRRR